MSGDGEHLMTAVLNRSRLMDADMPRLGGNHALVGFQHGTDDDLVGLGAPRQEKNLCLFAVARLPDFFFCTLAVFVIAVAGKRLPVRLRKTFQYFFMCSLDIIALK